jgi:hypothetical protein
MGSSEANELAPRFIDEVTPGGYIGVWALSVLKRSKISSASTSGSPPVAKRFWSRIVTALLRKLAHQIPLGVRSSDELLLDAFRQGWDAADLGRARATGPQTGTDG